MTGCLTIPQVSLVKDKVQCETSCLCCTKSMPVCKEDTIGGGSNPFERYSPNVSSSKITKGENSRILSDYHQFGYVFYPISLSWNELEPAGTTRLHKVPFATCLEGS